MNAIYTADVFLIPTTYGRYSLDGIADLFASIEEIREGERDYWILRNAFDSRNRATNTYIDQQLASVREYVLRTVIRRSEAINQAQINGEPVLTFDPQGHGAEDFRALTKEVVQHGCRQPLADAAASKLAKRHEGKGKTPTLITPRKIAAQPRVFRLAPVHLERLRRLTERLSEEAGRPISETEHA